MVVASAGWADPLSEPHQPQLEPSPFHQRLPWWGADLQTLRDTIRPQRLPEDLSSALTIDLGGADALLARLSLPQQEAPRALVVLIAGLVAMSGGVAGLVLSYHASLPTGPAMILTMGAIFLVSVLAGPAGGLISLVRAGPHRTG